jgi:hypothetical protein
MKQKCSVPGCRRHARARGFCSTHYWRHRTGRPLEPPVTKHVAGSIAKRTRARVKIDKETGCHLWTGFRNADGYGRIAVGPGHRLVHRVAWEAVHGTIPEGMILMHICDNRRCCNPEHLKLGTRAENNRDRVEKGRGNGARALDLEKHPQWGTASGRPPRRKRPARSQGQAAEAAKSKDASDLADALAIKPTWSPRTIGGASPNGGWRAAPFQLLRPIISGLWRTRTTRSPTRPASQATDPKPGGVRHDRA